MDTSEILFQRIVVATDFSKPAETALEQASIIAHLYGAELWMVHAITPPLNEVEGVVVPANILQADLEASITDIQELIARRPDLKALKPKVRVSYADPVQFIEQVAREEKADLVVVGSHGASGLERLALGSVAEAVLRKATCPVLITGRVARWRDILSGR